MGRAMAGLHCQPSLFAQSLTLQTLSLLLLDFWMPQFGVGVGGLEPGTSLRTGHCCLRASR